MSQRRSVSIAGNIVLTGELPLKVFDGNLTRSQDTTFYRRESFRGNPNRYTDRGGSREIPFFFTYIIEEKI